MTFEEQLRLLNTPPDVDLITPPDSYIQAPYLSGQVITHYLNEIFGPTGWGYALLEWPELLPLQEGKAGVYRCQGRVWFAFTDHDLVERLVPGLCAVRPRSGQSLESVGFEQMRMGYQGAITDMIKNAASTLGIRLGLGLNDQLLRAKLSLGSAFRPESPAESEEKLHPSTNSQHAAATQGNVANRAQPKGNGNGHGPAWIRDPKTRKAFWAGVEAKGLTHGFVHEALGVESLKEYRGSVGDVWKAINAALQAEMEAEKNALALDGVQEEIPF